MKLQGKSPRYETNIHSIPDFRMKYPELKAYNIPLTPVHESPCMSEYWRSQPIRPGKARDEIEHADYVEEDDELTDD
jgi:hypothetical protein